MRYSQLLIPTVKEVPAEAEIASHQLMIRAGFIRKLASGTYTYLPLGWRSLLKIIAIIRQEMDAGGAQEITMPILQPMELWGQTGRNVVFKEILCSFKDRHGRENVLAPTAEEVVTDLVAHEVSSYKQLPLNLYQINYKFRDEYRPQFGVIRSREFLMKDAYSFDATPAGLDESYKKMYDAYCRIFSRCGLKYVVVQAESGGMGGTDTEEFMVPCEVGDTLVMTEDGGYAANIEKAQIDPAERLELDGVGGIGEMKEVHTPHVGSIEAVCAFLKTKPAEMIKTLIFNDLTPEFTKDLFAKLRRAKQHINVLKVSLPKVRDTIREMESAIAKVENMEQAELIEAQMAEITKSMSFKEKASDESMEALTSIAREAFSHFVVAVVRGDHEVNLAKLQAVTGFSNLHLAGERTVQAITESSIGFAGPMGRDKDVGKLVIDHSVAAMAAGISGANKSDYHMLNVVPGRDFPLGGENVVVADIRNAVPGDTWQGRKLVFSHGVEIGHVFKLGTKYSEKLGATFLDEAGQSKPAIMGCYGIGVNRILAMAIEAGHDANGCILPAAIAPFEVLVVPINIDNPAVLGEAQRIHDELAKAGVDVLIDDRDARAGVKFKDADLLGIPVRVTVGERGLKEGKVEIKRRTDEKATLVAAGEAVATARQWLVGKA